MGPGTMYYHYTQHGEEVISRIADDDWDNYDEYHGKYLYDWDHTFRRQPLVNEKQHEDAEPVMRMLMLPHVPETPTTPGSMANAESSKKPKLDTGEITGGAVLNRFGTPTH